MGGSMIFSRGGGAVERIFLVDQIDFPSCAKQ